MCIKKIIHNSLKDPLNFCEEIKEKNLKILKEKMETQAYPDM
jgi:hypothetical protein